MILGALIQHWLCYRRYPESRCIPLFRFYERDADMSEVNEATIAEHARELCERDGFVWEFTYKPEPNRPQRPLTEQQKQEYLARARTELCPERGAA
jgi:hypothetical protein